MVDVKTSIRIARSQKEVASYVSNPDNAPEWYVNIKSAEWKTEKPLQIGSQIAFKAKFLGKELAYVYEIIELSDSKMVMRTANGPFPMKTTYIWTEIGENETEMILRNAGKPKGFSKLFSPLMVPAMRKANNKDLKLLKKILEDS